MEERKKYGLNITNLMMEIWKMNCDTGDWMGYNLQEDDIYTFHHLIVPKSKNGPKEIWNGAILCKNTAHTYLHLIEKKDRDLFDYVTSILIKINQDRKMPNYQTLLLIDSALRVFEVEYQGKKGKHNVPIIKEEYTRRKIKKNIYLDKW